MDVQRVSPIHALQSRVEWYGLYSWLLFSFRIVSLYMVEGVGVSGMLLTTAYSYPKGGSEKNRLIFT